MLPNLSGLSVCPTGVNHRDWHRERYKTRDSMFSREWLMDNGDREWVDELEIMRQLYLLHEDDEEPLKWLQENDAVWLANNRKRTRRRLDMSSVSDATGVLYKSMQEARDRHPGGVVEDVCPMCQEELDENGSIVVGSCRHAYHEGCIKQWYDRKKECALCKKEMTDDDFDTSGTNKAWDRYFTGRRNIAISRTGLRRPYYSTGEPVPTQILPRVAYGDFFPRVGLSSGFKQARPLPGAGGNTGWDMELETILDVDALPRTASDKERLEAFARVMFTMPPMVEQQHYDHGVPMDKIDHWTTMIKRVGMVIRYMVIVKNDITRKLMFDDYTQQLHRWMRMTELAVSRTLVVKDLWEKHVRPWVSAATLPTFSEETPIDKDCSPWDYCSVYFYILAELEMVSSVLSRSHKEPSDLAEAVMNLQIGDTSRANNDYGAELANINSVAAAMSEWIREASERAGVPFAVLQENMQAAFQKSEGEFVRKSYTTGRDARFYMGGNAGDFMLGSAETQRPAPKEYPVKAYRESEMEMVTDDVRYIRLYFLAKIQYFDGDTPTQEYMDALLYQVFTPEELQEAAAAGERAARAAEARAWASKPRRRVR